jgi:hypothetical protein
MFLRRSRFGCASYAGWRGERFDRAPAAIAAQVGSAARTSQTFFTLRVRQPAQRASASAVCNGAAAQHGLESAEYARRFFDRACFVTYIRSGRSCQT